MESSLKDARKHVKKPLENNELDNKNYQNPKNKKYHGDSQEKSSNSITMNLNMSFVKIKNPSKTKNGDSSKNSSQKI